MPHRTVRAAATLLLAVAAAAGAEARTAAGAGEAQGSLSADVRTALEEAIDFLLEDGDAWMEGRLPLQGGQKCISCHQVPFGLWGVEAAERAGIAVDGSAAASLRRRALEFAAGPGQGRVLSWGPLLLAPGGGNEGADPRPFVDFALGRQQAEGFWRARGQFPGQRRGPGETDTLATLWTRFSLATLAPGDEAVVAAVGRADLWLEGQAPGETTEWLLLRALNEGARGRAAAESRAGLLALQNPDGGWGWMADEESNAYSTGLILWGLGLGAERSPDEDSALERAARYLVRTQGDDGRWPLPSRLTSREASSGKDSVYAYWGSAWAAVGLSRWLQTAAAG